jgi:TolB-like protein
VVAWYHGDRGQQRVSGAELAILSVLLALGGAALWFYGQRNGQVPISTAPPAAPIASQGSSAASADERPSIAVLPFENRSRLDDDVFFVDGIHDDILTQLSKVSALKVISRTSVEQFRGTKLPTKAIADQLGVKSILEVGVQRSGDRRISVQLIDASTDAHLWAELRPRADGGRHLRSRGGIATRGAQGDADLGRTVQIRLSRLRIFRRGRHTSSATSR